MNAKLLNPGNYYSAADFTGEPTVEIVDVKLEDVEDEKNKVKRKGSITLKGIDKPWLCNVTNTKCLVAMFGDETDAWRGKRVTLVPERVMSFGEWVLGVRIKGSPDIAAPVNVSIRLRKKKTQVLTMQKTGETEARPSPPKPAPKTPYDEMWRDFKAAGRSDKDEFKGLINGAIAKKPADMTPDDVLKFSAALASFLAAPAEEPAPF